MFDTNSRTCGHRQKLRVPKLSHSTASTNYFAVRIVPVWNSLPDEIILAGNYHAFCKQLENVDLTKRLKRRWDISPWIYQFPSLELIICIAERPKWSTIVKSNFIDIDMPSVCHDFMSWTVLFRFLCILAVNISYSLVSPLIVILVVCGCVLYFCV